MTRSPIELSWTAKNLSGTIKTDHQLYRFSCSASLLLTSEKAVICNDHYHLHRHHLYNPHLTSAPSKQHPPPPTASGLATRKGGTWRLLCNNIIIILTIITTTMIIKIISIRKRRTRLRNTHMQMLYYDPKTARLLICIKMTGD